MQIQYFQLNLSVNVYVWEPYSFFVYSLDDLISESTTTGPHQGDSFGSIP